jgi:biotin carboxyl carrier protein
MQYVTRVEDKTFDIEVREHEIVIDGETHAVDLRHVEPLSLYSLLIDNLSHEILIEEQEECFNALLLGQLYAVDVQEKERCGQDASSSPRPRAKNDGVVAAPMPGLVLEVLTEVGQTVRSGDVVAILESMKMRIELHSPRDGAIQAVHAASHDHVSQGQALVTLSPQQRA